ncbi:MAG: hypothetical protein JSS62_02895 [Verrucomicrobia bacterium]|nr:hypothetical protein [Verrucomicrobiota bacterium]MBS0646393.1 hypothetical protein [Verrucomicrobiota bacterium]
MQQLAFHLPCPLTDTQQRYVTRTALPAALRVCNGCDLLQYQDYNQWLTCYRLGCSTPDMIAPYTELYEGLSEEQELSLKKERSSIATLWYPQYQNGEISKQDLTQLLAKFQAQYTQDPQGDSLPLTHPNLQTAYQQHITVMNQFFPNNPDKQKQYWKLSLTALHLFLNHVH